MANLARWDPVKEMLEVRDGFDRLVDRFFGRDFDLWPARVWNPAVDIYEDDNNVLVKAEVPGIRKEDIKLTLSGDTLTISGRSSSEKEVKEKNYYRKEIRGGSFTRSFVLPCPIDREKVSATYKDGVLEVTLPKAEEAKTKEVTIQVK
jgi:HSP20 family protein